MVANRKNGKRAKTRVRVKRIASRIKREHPNMKRSHAHAIARGRVKNSRKTHPKKTREIPEGNPGG